MGFDEEYGYEIWYEGNCIHSSESIDTVYESREDAEYEALEWVKDCIRELTPDSTINDYDIRIKEI